VTDNEVKAILENATVVFGLQAQGHIPTITEALAIGKSWDEIGKLIGWDPATAKEHWGWYQEAGRGPG
jgi:hypothetical protein